MDNKGRPLQINYKSKNKTPMIKLGRMMKLLLNEETKVLYKAGLINGELELTKEGRAALRFLDFQEKRGELVILAKEKIEKEKEEEAKTN